VITLTALDRVFVCCYSSAVAQGYGGLGMDITSTDDDAVTVFRKAQAAVARGESVLVNAHIGSTNFREGSISV
jgi:hypothetical protein